MLDLINTKPFVIAISIIGILYSIILHEIAHGFSAYLLGDDTAKSSKRLSLNPYYHIDLFGTIIIPLLCFIMELPAFGWAKPVPVDFNNFKYNRRLSIAIVSIAGVFVNFLISLLMFYLYIRLNVKAALFIMQINIILMIFNLIPLPPLDGYNFITSILPPRLAYKIMINQTTFIVIFLFLIVTGWIRFILNPIYNLVIKFYLTIFGMGG